MKRYKSIFKEEKKYLKERKISFSWNQLYHDFGPRQEGLAYIAHGTLKNINEGIPDQQAFEDACENENFYGHRPDIVKERQIVAKYLFIKFAIVVDPVNGKF